jgi:hypothetical protein
VSLGPIGSVDLANLLVIAGAAAEGILVAAALGLKAALERAKAAAVPHSEAEGAAASLAPAARAMAAQAAVTVARSPPAVAAGVLYPAPAGTEALAAEAASLSPRGLFFMVFLIEELSCLVGASGLRDRHRVEDA